jgi:hypothetical protein
MTEALHYPFADVEPDYRHLELMTQSTQRLGDRSRPFGRVRGLIVRPRRRPAVPRPGALASSACRAGKC